MTPVVPSLLNLLSREPLQRPAAPPPSGTVFVSPCPVHCRLTGRSPILDPTGARTGAPALGAPTHSISSRYLGSSYRDKAVRVAFIYKNKKQGFMVFARVQRREMCVSVQVYLCTFLTFALDKGEWSASRSGRCSCCASQSLTCREQRNDPRHCGP